MTRFHTRRKEDNITWAEIVKSCGKDFLALFGLVTTALAIGIFVGYTWAKSPKLEQVNIEPAHTPTKGKGK
tara:strand:+ start:536 stop:748 length:213 start_codon:yes stop_codon:yes gene_type:complete